MKDTLKYNMPLFTLKHNFIQKLIRRCYIHIHDEKNNRLNCSFYSNRKNTY